MPRLVRPALALVAGALLPGIATGQTDPSSSVVGLWEAKRRFGPDVSGQLVLDRPAAQWRASIAGRTANARVTGDSISFDLPDGGGSYIGRFEARRTRIVGQWIQPRMVTEGRRYAAPLTLARCGDSDNCFSGRVVPVTDEFTFYMKVTRRPDGSLGAFFRNPERNLGRFIRLDRLEVEGSSVRLLDAKGALLMPGVIREGFVNGKVVPVLTIYIGNRGGSYDFTRVADGAFTYFYPRGHPTASYAYTPPRQQNDGWRVGTLSDVGLKPDKLQEFMHALVNSPVDSVGSLYVHSILIARHGKLALEEYFFGEHGEKPHNTRSASKSVLNVVIGAAMQAGAKIDPNTRVYSVMRPDTTNPDPRKQALTMEHLLDMASGLDCDDGGAERPGNEGILTQQDSNPDWYRTILDLGMVRDPGVQAVYCSINPHLAGGVLSRATKRSLPDLTWSLVGEPLQMSEYHMMLTPLGEGYMGGGMAFRPRDFLKLGQLYLDRGTWNGRRVVSAEWVKRSTVPRYRIGNPSNNNYGYLWWTSEYPHEGRTLRAFHASGNGGQYVMVFPELDLVVAVFGGNYNERAGSAFLRTLVPQYVLPAVVAR
jgi:CubicO group peptidase (beta-lactamase class C family)